MCEDGRKVFRFCLEAGGEKFRVQVEQVKSKVLIDISYNLIVHKVNRGVSYGKTNSEPDGAWGGNHAVD